MLGLHWCYTEVCNGGFHQFFSNWTGGFAPEALAAAGSVGLNHLAAIIEAALKALAPAGYPRDLRERSLLLGREGLWEELLELNDRFFQTTRDERLFFAADAFVVS